MEYTGNGSRRSACLGSISDRAPLDLVWVVEGNQEEVLIANAQRGDLAAFNELVLMYQNIVYRRAFWLLKEEEAAEDAAQESFLKAYRNIHTFILGRPFHCWLLKITTNHCLDMIRRAQYHHWLPLERTDLEGENLDSAYWIKDPNDTPDQVVENAEVGRRIALAIQRLAPEYRTVVILADLHELDYAEISAILKIPLGTMKSRLFRARRQLRKALL